MEPSRNNNVSDSSTSGSDDVVFSNKPKPSKGMVVALVCAIVLAVGGIGFGVWAMIYGNQKVAKKDEQIAELNEEVEKKGQAGSEVIDVEVNENYVPDSSNAVNTAGYLYVGEWGLKIKIPENLTVTGYRYKMGAGYTSIAVLGNSKGGQYFPDFANLEKNESSLGVAERITKDHFSGPEYDGVPDDVRVCGVDAGLVFSDDTYNYCFGGPQDVMSTDKDEQNWEMESAGLVKQMLSDKNNYSAI